MQLGRVGTSAWTLRAAVASSGVVTIGTFFVNLLLIPVVLSQEGEVVYGSWVALFTVVGIAALADGGIRTEVALRVAQANGAGDGAGVLKAVRSGLSTVIFLTVPICCVLYILAPSAADALFPAGNSGNNSGELSSVLEFLVVCLGVQLVGGAYVAALRGLQRQDLELWGQLLGLVVGAGVTLVGMGWGAGIWALAWGHASGIVFALGFQVCSLRVVYGPLRPRIERPSVAHISYLGLSGLALLSQLSEVFDSQWDRLVVAHVLGPESVTAFHVGVTLPSFAKAVAVVPLAPLLVVVAESRRASPGATAEVQRRLMKLSAVFAAATLGTLFVFGPAFVTVWLGSGYEDTGGVLRGFTIAVAVNVAIAPMAMQAFGEKHHKLCALGALVNIVVNAVLSLFLTIHLGLMGAIYGSIAGNVAGAVAFFLVARWRLSYWVSPPLAAVTLSVFVSGALILLGYDAPGSTVALVGAAIVMMLGLLTVGVRVEQVSWRGLARSSDAPNV